MKPLARLALCFTALLAPLLAPAEPAAYYEHRLDVAGETVTVHLAAQSLSEAETERYSALEGIDGEPVLGGFPGRPQTRLGKFYLDWGERRLTVPERHYRDVFSPHLGERLGWWHNEGGILVRAADDGEAVMIQMEASRSACCGYLVTWIVGRDGGVRRFVDRSIP